MRLNNHKLLTTIPHNQFTIMQRKSKYALLFLGAVAINQVSGLNLR
jgi:hypothetical protein